LLPSCYCWVVSILLTYQPHTHPGEPRKLEFVKTLGSSKPELIRQFLTETFPGHFVGYAHLHTDDAIFIKLFSDFIPMEFNLVPQKNLESGYFLVY
jgi:hypothetical protein